MTKTKAIIAFLLAIGAVMLMSVSVFATTGSGTAEDPLVVTTYDELRDNLARKNDTSDCEVYIKLGADIEQTDSINNNYLTLSSSHTLTVHLDLAGYDLSRKTESIDKALLTVNQGNHTLNIYDTVGGAHVDYYNSALNATLATVWNSGGTLNIYGGSFYANEADKCDLIYLSGGTTNIYGGNFYAAMTVVTHAAGDAYIYGGTYYTTLGNASGERYMCGLKFSSNYGNFIIYECRLENLYYTSYNTEISVAGAAMQSSRAVKDHLAEGSCITADGKAVELTDTTYKVKGHSITVSKLKITKQPSETTYFTPGYSAKATCLADNDYVYYEWYYKTPAMDDYALYGKYTAADGYDGTIQFSAGNASGLSNSDDGTKLYCIVGGTVRSQETTLKQYQRTVDRNAAIKIPEVGETAEHYLANGGVELTELLIRNVYFTERTEDNSFVKNLENTDRFREGYKYELCIQAAFPEYVDPNHIYRFYSCGLIVNGVENGAADSINDPDEIGDDETVWFTDFWTTPVLEGTAPVYDGIYGDANADKIVSASDAAAVLQKSLSASSIRLPLEDETDDWLTYVDVNQDGIVSASDAAYILQAALSKSFELPHI